MVLYGPGVMIARIIGSQISPVFIVLQLWGVNPFICPQITSFPAPTPVSPIFSGIKNNQAKIYDNDLAPPSSPLLGCVAMV